MLHVLLQKVKTKKPTKRIGMEEWTYVHALGQYNIWKYSIEQLHRLTLPGNPASSGFLQVSLYTLEVYTLHRRTCNL